MIRNASFFLILSLLLMTGCATERTFTISTIPPDATIRIDGIDRGKGPIEESFTFKNAQDEHRITVLRPGYKDATLAIRRDEPEKSIVIPMKPETKQVRFSIGPVPAVLRIDGMPVTSEPVSNWSDTLEFTKDARENWREYKVTAEREGFAPAEATVRFPDRESTYTLTLTDLTKEVNVSSQPSGATVYLDDQEQGKTPFTIDSVKFPFSTETNSTLTHRIKVVKPGYDPVEREIGWAEGMTDEHFDLTAKNKTVKIITDPPQAKVALNAPDQPSNIENGNPIYSLAFPPINEDGELRTYEVTISKDPVDGTEWKPAQVTIQWDGGQTDYHVKLEEILTTPVALLRPKLARNADGWAVVPERLETVAVKNPAEPGGVKVDRVVSSQAGENIDTLTVSPDGASVVYSVLYDRPTGDFVSQIRSMTNGAAEQQLTDNRSLYLMPSYSPDGNQVLFSSNRFSKRLSILAVSLDGKVGTSQLTRDGFDLWPSLDSGPESYARLYYQRMLDTRDDPRVFWSPKLAGFPTDMISGMQPRVSPSADSIVYVVTNENTGKRDIYRLTDEPGATPQNLTNTPDIDEYDPVISRDGGRIAFVSDEASSNETGRNNDIWIMDLRQPGKPTQITSNGSWDDSPAWNPSNSAIYFRSNRGGSWGIWKMDIK